MRVIDVATYNDPARLLRLWCELTGEDLMPKPEAPAKKEADNHGSNEHMYVYNDGIYVRTEEKTKWKAHAELLRQWEDQH
jgi:hypothetical protein